MKILASWLATHLIGWVITAFLATLMAIPVHFLWSWLAPVYLSFLPVVYLKIGFFDMLGILALIAFAKIIFFPASFNVVPSDSRKK